ncbi:hypothetical protein FQR65_LT00700 [Abscondita terminalis]|nr:hypothetical protein FQR65_LT00700 [Abscondita terminalis]
MNEIASPSPPPRQTTASPPPKCAICLGTCTNKCFSDSCRHQFCFTCLLEWSKVKAECPLCKQPFKSIIYNIKSNEEYDEHIINNEPLPGSRGFLDNENYLYLPPSPSRHFQFRTTFTVDSGGELAIQQMLLSHPLTNSLYNIPDSYVLPRQSRFGRLRHTRRASSATSFRRSIYMTNMWVYAPPDMTGRYREVTPHFFRENPAARNRLVPWLNRELNALLSENTQQVMHLVDIIMDYLTRWHIRSRSFKRLLENYLTNKTDHFIHEFYNFMRSPYDMIGYDRHVIYSDRPHSPTYLISDPEDDSDVAIVNISEPITVNNNPFRRPTIEVIEINSDSSHDSDVIIGETPVPEVVLVDSDSNDGGKTTEPLNNNVNEDSDESEVNRKPILPLKIRLKKKRQSKEKRSRNKKRSHKRHRSSSPSFSSSSSDDSSDSSSSCNESTHRRSKRKHKHKKLKARCYKDHKESKSRLKEKYRKLTKPTETETSSSSDSDTCSSNNTNAIFDSDDSIPLSQIKHKELKKQKAKKIQAHGTKNHTLTSKSSEQNSLGMINGEDHSKPSCSRWTSTKVDNSTSFEKFNSVPSTSSTSSTTKVFPSTSNALEESFVQISDSSPYYQIPLKNHVLDFDASRYEPFNQYPLFGSTYNISPISVGSRYYDGDLNVPKPLDYFSNCDSREYSCQDNKVFQYYTPNNVDIPSRVNVGVGTSPVHNDTEFINGNCYSNEWNNSHRMQSVIVKKEDKDNLNTFRTVSNDSDTESM